MDLEFQNQISNAISNLDNSEDVINEFEVAEEGGVVEYNPEGVFITPDTPGFTGHRTSLNDEEAVRAFLVARLIEDFGYSPSPEVIELETEYGPVGRPTGKGGRIDVIIRREGENGDDPFLFIECKAPSKYDGDMDYIENQLFNLSKQEDNQPKYLVYHTTEYSNTRVKDRTLIIDTDQHPTFDSWNEEGQPSIEVIPYRYGQARKKRYANIEEEQGNQRPLDEDVGPTTFNRIRDEIHNVVWGGGSTNNNDVFINIVKLILCKIYDEREAQPGDVYEFQRRGTAEDPESAENLVERMNDLYDRAEEDYLALPDATTGPAFDTTRISAEKIAYVVGRFEPISVTNNRYDGDILGDFFEKIIGQNFTQDKTQFFTHVNLVRFMIKLANTEDTVKDVLRNERDEQGSPRLPHTIDPSCGSGTFLIEYMKYVTDKIGNDEFADELPQSIKESHHTWFQGLNQNRWAKDFIYGIEENYDLGLSAKVNMILHGDGSMNTWIKNGLLPFNEYWLQGRNNTLGVTSEYDNHPYSGEINEQFDFIFTNPPFSVDLPDDEQNRIEDIFEFDISTRSETLFIERWYQLLREGGYFCAVLPEAVLDTSSYGRTRVFLLKHFKLEAIVSLPYLAFEPFTSTKTCIVLAKKRPSEKVREIRQKWDQVENTNSLIADSDDATEVFDTLDLEDEEIFMAEPDHIGYKRRKNLPDLSRPNNLFPPPSPEEVETDEQDIAEAQELNWMDELDLDNPETVLEQFRAGYSNTDPDSEIGFWTTLKDVVSRDGLRMDPKYRWLWDVRDGVVVGASDEAIELSQFLELADMSKIDKGFLEEPRTLIDLDAVEARQGIIIEEEVELVSKVGSKRVIFDDCDIIFSKLEPYLAKVLTDWPSDSIGSPEWVGLNITNENYTPTLISYILMLPESCEAYRRIQSGKRHARLDKDEMLKLKFEMPNEESSESISESISEMRDEIVSLREKEKEVRSSIDFSLLNIPEQDKYLNISEKIDPKK